MVDKKSKSLLGSIVSAFKKGKLPLESVHEMDEDDEKAVVDVESLPMPQPPEVDAEEAYLTKKKKQRINLIYMAQLANTVKQFDDLLSCVRRMIKILRSAFKNKDMTAEEK